MAAHTAFRALTAFVESGTRGLNDYRTAAGMPGVFRSPKNVSALLFPKVLRSAGDAGVGGYPRTGQPGFGK